MRNRAAKEVVITTFNVDDINFDALLFKAGYLTITEKISTGFRTLYTLDYPNLEVWEGLKEELLVYLSGWKKRVLQLGDALLG